MSNPFSFGSPLEDSAAFADRRDELAEISQLMLDGQNAILLSPRRYGKTSLLLRCIEDVRRRRGRTGYANLARCTSRREVAEELLRATVAGPLSWLRRRQHELGEYVSQIRATPDITFTADGLPVVRFTGSRGEEAWDEVLADTLRLLRRAHTTEHPVSLVIDEFQQIAVIPPGLGGLFKSVADELRPVSLVLSGSVAHLLEALTEGTGAPLYGMGERINLPVISETDMVAHLVARAAAAGRPMTAGVAQTIYRRAGPVPNDVQRLAYYAFNQAQAGIEADHVELAFSVVVRHEGADYQRRFEGLSPAPVQQRVLKRLAAHPTAQPYARAFLEAIDLPNSNAVKKALRTLAQRELIAHRDGVWLVTDPFFREWLARPAG